MDCRFYQKEHPDIEDVVIVQVKSLSDVGAYVNLLEYNRVEGMIQISEMSNRRIRSINKLTKTGNIEATLVLRVDAERGYIDLSKKRVHGEDIQKAKGVFAKAKVVQGIMRHVATILGRETVEVCGVVAWPLYAALGTTTPKVYDMLRRMVYEKDVAVLFAHCPELEKDVPMQEALMSAASRKLTQHEVRVRALFDLTCFSTDGVLAIKEAVRVVKAENESAAAPGVVIKVISAPQFLIQTSGIGREASIARIDAALARLKEEIEKRGGNYKLRAAADVIGEDEEELPKFVDEDISSDESEDDNEIKSGSDEDSSSSSSSDEDEKKKDKRKKSKGKK